MKPRTPLPKRAWGILILLVTSMTVSFVDRGNLAVAAPVLGPEIGLSTWQIGLLLSAFFWTYATTQIAAGWLVDRMEVRWVYTAGFLLWSAATLSTAAVASFLSLIHISEPTRLGMISYAVFCLKKKKNP